MSCFFKDVVLMYLARVCVSFTRCVSLCAVVHGRRLGETPLLLVLLFLSCCQFVTFFFALIVCLVIFSSCHFFASLFSCRVRERPNQNHPPVTDPSIKPYYAVKLSPRVGFFMTDNRVERSLHRRVVACRRAGFLACRRMKERGEGSRSLA